MDGLLVPMRGVRVDNERWRLFGEALQREPDHKLRSRSAMIRAFIDFYIGQGDADRILPPDLKHALTASRDA